MLRAPFTLTRRIQILWNKLGFHPSHILGGMPTDEILKESGHDREQALSTIGSGLGLGTSREGFHAGWGWLVFALACPPFAPRRLVPGEPGHGTLTCPLLHLLLSAHPSLRPSRDSHGSVTCHSYGCGVNFATSPSVADMANAKA